MVWMHRPARPLTKPGPIRVAHSKRVISNLAGMSIPKELTKAILRALKIVWVNSFLKLHCDLANGFECPLHPLT